MAVAEEERAARFARLMTPHLASAYGLARWLTGNPHAAEDVVQEAYLKAWRAFDGYAGGSSRAWLLAIVRNASHSARRAERPGNVVAFDDAHAAADHPADAPDPEASLLARRDQLRVRDALRALPPIFREVLVLREIEGLSYDEIAAVVGIPIGTVMSRLARGRERLRQALAEQPPRGRNAL